MSPAPWHTTRWVVAACCAAGLLVGAGAAGAAAERPPATVYVSTTPAAAHTTITIVVRVKKNHLVNASGTTVRLLGVDRSGTEYACEQGWGIFDGPATAASVTAVASWHVNAVRLPLNEGCWLGLYTTANDPYAIANPAPYEGAAYRAAIGAYVTLLQHHGMAVILCLTSIDERGGMDVPPMADAAHSPAFWTSIATYFKANKGVLFDLYNEPNAISWPCWKNGCQVTTSAATYETAGMQALVTAVRATGATQPIMLGGLDYSSDETSWRTYLPKDPDKSLVVSFHTYNSTNCNTLACWTTEVAPLAKVVPVVTGEVGEYDCSTPYTDAYMKFADAKGISYLGWAWDAISPGGWSCSGPALITNYNGTPSPEGVALHGHLQYLFAHKEIVTSP